MSLKDVPWVQITEPQNLDISLEERVNQILAGYVRQPLTSRILNEMYAALMTLLTPIVDNVRVYVYVVDTAVKVEIFDGPDVTATEIKAQNAAIASAVEGAT